MQLRTVDLEGPTNIADFGGSGPPMVLVHGLGGSVYNWVEVGPRLAERHRVLALDLPGFGRTPPAGRSAHVESLRAVLDRLITKEIGQPTILIGNSMGGLIAMMEAAAAPEAVERLVLVNPAAAAPGAIRSVDPQMVVMAFGSFIRPAGRMLLAALDRRTTPTQRVTQTFQLIAFDPSRVSQETRRLHVAANAERRHQPWAHTAFQQAYASVLVTLFPPRFDRMVAKIEAPTLLIHGTADRVVPLAAARRLAGLRPDWRFERFANVGHVPILEAPDRFLEATERFLAGSSSPRP